MEDRKRNKAVSSAKRKELLRSPRVWRRPLPSIPTVCPVSLCLEWEDWAWGWGGEVSGAGQFISSTKHKQSISNISTKFYVFPPVLFRKEQADAKMFQSASHSSFSPCLMCPRTNLGGQSSGGEAATQHWRIQSVNVPGSTHQTLTASNQCKKLLCKMDFSPFESETRKPAL